MPRPWQVRGLATATAAKCRVDDRPPRRRSVISAVTMPVGTASVPQPSSSITEAMKRPSSVFGVMSPNPTVVIVVIAQ